MAPMMKNLLAAFALATLTSAVPLAFDKREPDTVTETVWTTVDVTTTVYIDGPSALPEVESAPPAEPTAETSSTTSAAPIIPEATPAAVPEAPPAAPPAPVADAPAAFAAAASPSAAPAPSSAPAPPAPEAPDSSPSSSSAAAAPIEAKTAGSSSGGPCEGSDNVCTGDVTHYDGGLGACGWDVDTTTEMQIALPHALMGTQSNGNPYCGRSLTIKSPNGGTVKATVGDKCMGCEGASIDLTDALFAAVVPDGDGRVSGIEWYFD